LLPHHRQRPGGSARMGAGLARDPRLRRFRLAGARSMNVTAGTAQLPSSADVAPADAERTDPAHAAAAGRDADLPRSIPDYLQRLRDALRGADPALIQDALYDAEEYLRSEMAENPGRSEAEVIASVAGSYGAPDEVAEIYRDTEVTVQTALRTP